MVFKPLAFVLSLASLRYDHQPTPRSVTFRFLQSMNKELSVGGKVAVFSSCPGVLSMIFPG